MDMERAENVATDLRVQIHSHISGFDLERVVDEFDIRNMSLVESPNEVHSHRGDLSNHSSNQKSTSMSSRLYKWWGRKSIIYKSTHNKTLTNGSFTDLSTQPSKDSYKQDTHTKSDFHIPVETAPRISRFSENRVPVRRPPGLKDFLDIQPQMLKFKQIYVNKNTNCNDIYNDDANNTLIYVDTEPGSPNSIADRYIPTSPVKIDSTLSAVVNDRSHGVLMHPTVQQRTFI